MAGSSAHGTHLEIPRSESVAGRESPGNGAEATLAGDEIARLEGLLAERVVELAGDRAEIARLRGLLRDTFDRLSAPAESPVGSEQLASLQRERDGAVQRALEAEFGRAEISCRLDEALGHLLAAAEGEGGRQGETLDVTCARLAGTVRGMVSALAEAEETRDVAVARLVLLEDDHAEARAQARARERELAEAREQLELEHIRRVGLEARLATLSAHTAEQATRIAELDRGLAREIENTKELVAELVRERAQTMVVGEELERARQQAGAAQRSNATLLEARELLQDLAASVEAVVRVDRESALEQSWDETTEPGLPSVLTDPDEKAS